MKMEKFTTKFQEAIGDIEGGVFFDSVGNAVDTTFNLRGFSDKNAVIVLLDGVRVNELDGDVVNYSLIPMYNIESIQIDRGSVSPMFGSGAFGGVVHITTRRPSAKPLSIFGGAEWSSYEGVRFYNGLSGTLQDNLTPIGGAFTYYFNMGRDLNEGFRENGEIRITSLDLKTSYELPDDSGRVHAGVKHIDSATSNPGSLTLQEFHDAVEESKNVLDGRDFKNTIIQNK